MDKIAVLIKDNLPGYRGRAALYKLSEPLEGHEFVVVSSVLITFPPSVKEFINDYHESFVFPADEEGNILDWGNLDGSLSYGTQPIPHEVCFQEAGYQLVYQ